MVADIAAVLVGAIIAMLLQWMVKPVPEFIVRDHIVILVLSLPLFLGAAVVFGLYQARANERAWEERRNIVKAVVVLVGGVVMLSFFGKYDGLSRFWVVALFVSTTLALFVEREIVRRIGALGEHRLTASRVP
jgi:FlaA1/EpsC-like NDP-sugar epimerase